MKRLTIKASSGLIHLKDNKEITVNEAIKKLSDYEDLEEQSLMKIFPCKEGSTVYGIRKSGYCPSGICRSEKVVVNVERMRLIKCTRRNLRLMI